MAIYQIYGSDDRLLSFDGSITNSLHYTNQQGLNRCCLCWKAFHLYRKYLHATQRWRVLWPKLHWQSVARFLWTSHFQTRNVLLMLKRALSTICPFVHLSALSLSPSRIGAKVDSCSCELELGWRPREPIKEATSMRWRHSKAVPRIVVWDKNTNKIVKD
jgi:hypothetical protein